MNRSNVEEIKARMPIEELIGTYIKVERAGKSLKARCPFHNEKTASFFISPERGGYYCFGCGAKGDIFTFVEQFEGLDFKGALKVLAEKAGVPLVVDQKVDSERDRLFHVMEAAAKFYEEQFDKSKEAREYLKGRGISPETRESFRIGWAPQGWKNIMTYLKGKGWSEAILEKAGLIKMSADNDSGTSASNNRGVSSVPADEASLPTFASEASKTKGDLAQSLGRGDNNALSPKGRSNSVPNYYDRFRGRIMFPITDSSGRVVAFTGRILVDDGKSAKYLNSPESPLFNKSAILFGLDKAKTEIRRVGYSILVEGQMDLVLSHQVGVKNTIAASGTALTDQAKSEAGVVSNLGMVRRLSTNMIIALDSDKAGRTAAMRAVAATALSMGMSVKIADIEGGKDPADLILNDPESWKNVLRNAKHVIEFELDNVLREVSDPHKLSKAVRDRVFPFLARIDSEMDKAFYVKRIAEQAGLTELSVWEDLKKTEKLMKAAASTAGSSVPARQSNFPGSDESSASQTKGKLAEPKGHGMQTEANQPHRLDLVERRMFGLLALMESVKFPAATEYREQIKKIAADSYDERLKKIEPMLSDLLFEAEALFGQDLKHSAVHMKELIFNFEEDLINEDLVVVMGQLRAAERDGESDRVAELAKKCQELSIKKSEVAKKRKL